MTKKLSLLCLFCILASLPGLWVPYFNIDEVTNLLYARLYNAGDLGFRDFLGSPYFLTFSIYIFIDRLFDLTNLIPIHLIHMFWRCATAIVYFFAGRALKDEKTGWIAAFLYVVVSFSFMSKDFHTPSAEAWSILPAGLAFYFLFSGEKKRTRWKYFACGFCLGVATLFKAPIGALLPVFLIAIILQGAQNIFLLLFVVTGFCTSIFIPFLFYQPFFEGLILGWNKNLETKQIYIDGYVQTNFLEFIARFLSRTSLVAIAMFPIVIPALYMGVKRFSFLNLKDKQHFLFLAGSSACLLSLTLLGKRIFFHYYVFLVAALPLVGALVWPVWLERLRRISPAFMKGWIVLCLIGPVGFGIEAAIGGSVKAPNVKETVEYVRQHTTPSDRIYVWGYVPQIYVEADRLPATVHFWSDRLAGTSPGTASMEYKRATGEELTILEKIRMDFSGIFKPLQKQEKFFFENSFKQNELFELQEILDQMQDPYWQNVFYDFTKNPPKLFLDTAPSNIRGFNYFPVAKFEPLRVFLAKYYQFSASTDLILIYERR